MTNLSLVILTNHILIKKVWRTPLVATSGFLVFFAPQFIYLFILIYLFIQFFSLYFFRLKVFTEYGFAISNKFGFYSDYLKKNFQVLIFCWWFPLLVKIDNFTFEVIIENYSQNIAKKQFLRQLAVPTYKHYLLWNSYINEKCFTFF